MTGEKRYENVTEKKLTTSWPELSSGNDMSDATLLLNAVGQGDPQSSEKLLELVYEELRRLAISKMAREAPGQTL